MKEYQKCLVKGLCTGKEIKYYILEEIIFNDFGKKTGELTEEEVNQLISKLIYY